MFRECLLNPASSVAELLRISKVTSILVSPISSPALPFLTVYVPDVKISGPWDACGWGLGRGRNEIIVKRRNRSSILYPRVGCV